MDLLQIMEEENSSFQKFNIALKLLEVSCYFYHGKIFTKAVTSSSKNRMFSIFFSWSLQ